MTTPPSDKSGPWVLDFNQPMRPKTRAYVKITYGYEVKPGDRLYDTQPNRIRLFEEIAAEQGGKVSK